MVFAFQQFWRATGDDSVLDSMVYPVANATARYWVARSTLVPAEDGSVTAHIYDIQPADEWHSHVNDSGKIVMRSRFAHAPSR